jgi:hypothetical protein
MDKCKRRQKTKLALLFDFRKMKSAQEATFNKLKQRKNASGGFVVWNEENEYITRHILRVRHLAKLNTDNATKAKIDEISKDGIRS